MCKRSFERQIDYFLAASHWLLLKLWDIDSLIAWHNVSRKLVGNQVVHARRRHLVCCICKLLLLVHWGLALSNPIGTLLLWVHQLISSLNNCINFKKVSYSWLEWGSSIVDNLSLSRCDARSGKMICLGLDQYLLLDLLRAGRRFGRLLAGGEVGQIRKVSKLVLKCELLRDQGRLLLLLGKGDSPGCARGGSMISHNFYFLT
jgi:hypothetical protein